MKAEINTNENQFEPIEVKITIENMKELVTLASMLNSSINSIEESRPKKLKDFEAVSGIDFWNKIGVTLTEIALLRR